MSFSVLLCRTRGSPGDAISELLLPRFVDMVIWGHEHECLIDPQVKLIDPQVKQDILVFKKRARGAI
jgi:hypothetical protein